MSISPSSPPPPPPAPAESSTSLSSLIRTTLSYDTNVMLAAIISLLLVILFVLLLHLYTRWFLLHARRRSHTSVAVPGVLGSRFHQRFTIIDSDHSSAKLGLPISIISSLPLFVHKFPSIEDCDDYGLECAICLCLFQDEEIGRKLPGCGHAFHVECIDMWLHSHSTCPICRAAIQSNHSRKIDRLEIEISTQTDEHNSAGLTAYNDEDSRLEIVTVTAESNLIVDPSESVDVVESSSSIGESQAAKKLLIAGSSCSSRSGGKVHPSSIVNDDESEA